MIDAANINQVCFVPEYLLGAKPWLSLALTRRAHQTYLFSWTGISVLKNVRDFKLISTLCNKMNEYKKCMTKKLLPFLLLGLIAETNVARWLLNLPVGRPKQPQSKRVTLLPVVCQNIWIDSPLLGALITSLYERLQIPSVFAGVCVIREISTNNPQLWIQKNLGLTRESNIGMEERNAEF